jgi:hypothetical protein
LGLGISWPFSEPIFEEASQMAERRVNLDHQAVALGVPVGPGNNIPVGPDMYKALKEQGSLTAQQPEDPDAVAKGKLVDCPNCGGTGLVAAEAEDGGSTEFPGLAAKTVDLLTDAGFETADSVRNATDEQLLDIEGIGATTLKKIREATKV